MSIENRFQKPVRAVPAASTPAHTSSPIPASTVSSEPLRTKGEAAAYLRIKPETIYQLTRHRNRHPLPYLPCDHSMRINPNAQLAGSGLSRTDTALRRRLGRPPKHKVAMPPSIRTKESRERKKLKLWEEGGLKAKFNKENSVAQGRQHVESIKSPEQIEEIRHGQARDAIAGGLSPEQLAGLTTFNDPIPSGGGRRVRPEGYGGYKNQEGGGTGKNEPQIKHPVRERSEKKNRKKQRDALKQSILQGFIEIHFIQATFCLLPDEDTADEQIYLICKLCPYETDRTDRNDRDIKTAFREAEWHVLQNHLPELEVYRKDKLPARVNPAQEKQLTDKPHECPDKAKHEPWRLKAAERFKQAIERTNGTHDSLRQEEKESVCCPTCHAVIFLPPEPAAAPRDDKKRKAEGEWRYARANRDEDKVEPRRIDASLARQIAKNQCFADVGSLAEEDEA